MSAPAQVRSWWLSIGFLGLLCGSPRTGLAKASSYSKADDGSKVLYLLLDDLGYQVSRVMSLRGLRDKPKHERPDAVFVLGATQPREPDRALRWLAGGGLLVLAPPLRDDRGHCKNFRFGDFTIERVYRFGHEDSARAADGRLAMRPHTCVTKAPDGATVLASTKQGAIVYDVPRARGRILVLAHDSMVRNLTLDRDDLTVILRRHFDRCLPGGAKIVFLEEHHGGQLWRMLERANLVPLFFHGLLVLALIYWKITPRFGDADPFEPSRRRAFSEHARGLASLQQAVGASGYQVGKIYERFRQRLRRRDRSASDAKKHAAAADEHLERRALAQMLATRTGRDAESIETLLAHAHYAGADPVKDKRAMQRDYRLAVDLARLCRDAGLSKRRWVADEGLDSSPKRYGRHDDDRMGKNSG